MTPLFRLSERVRKAATSSPAQHNTTVTISDISKVLAVVKAAQTYVADHGRDVMEPECVSCRGLLETIAILTKED